MDLAKDERGKLLHFDGTTDVVEFFKDFDAYCQMHGLGGVISRNNFAEPAYPHEAYQRTAAFIATDKDYDTITKYNDAMVKFLEKCEHVLRLLKWALSSTLQTNLEEALPVEWENADRKKFREITSEDYHSVRSMDFSKRRIEL